MTRWNAVHCSCSYWPGCKRLHLSFGPSERDRRSGRAKNQILSGVRNRGCVRRASSSRPRAHRRRPRPTVWVGGCESGGLRCRQLKPACTRASSAVCSRCPPGFSRSLLTSRSPLTLGAPSRWRLPTHYGCLHSRSSPNTARLQALASDFWPVLGGQIGRTGDNSDPKQYRRLRRSHSPLVLPNTARLQALASDFWPVLGGSIVRTGVNPDRKAGWLGAMQ